MMKLDFHHFQVCQALTMFITSNLNVTVVLGQCQRADLTVFGEIFPYTSSIFSVYVVFENVWTPLSASFSRLLQRYSWRGNCFQLLIGKFWVLFVLWIQSILHRFAFGGDKLLVLKRIIEYVYYTEQGLCRCTVVLAQKISLTVASWLHFFLLWPGSWLGNWSWMLSHLDELIRLDVVPPLYLYSASNCTKLTLSSSFSFDLNVFPHVRSTGLSRIWSVVCATISRWRTRHDTCRSDVIQSNIDELTNEHC